MQQLRDKLELALEHKRSPLRYSNFAKGGLLSKNVDSFTFFKTIDQNNAFLELINFSDVSEGAFPVGDELCQNLRQYLKVTMDECAGNVPLHYFEPDSDRYKKYFKRREAYLKRDDTNIRTWKDDYLLFYIYVRSGTAQKFADTLDDISKGRILDVFHE